MMNYSLTTHLVQRLRWVLATQERKEKKRKKEIKKGKKKESMTRLRHTCMQDTTLLHL